MVLRPAASGPNRSDLAAEELFFLFGELSRLDAGLLDDVEKSI